MSRHIFWEDSWNTFDPARVAPYADHLAQAPDSIIQYLPARKPASVCDAGCGCGAYALKLSRLGYSVSGFDISERAVGIARQVLASEGFPSGDFRTADITSTGFGGESFDAVVSRDVIDHLPLRSGIAAVQELLRITRPGGRIIFTLDSADEEYVSAPHTVSPDGDWLFTSGKWNGMVFHPYSPAEIRSLVLGSLMEIVGSEGRYTVIIQKPSVKGE